MDRIIVNRQQAHIMGEIPQRPGEPDEAYMRLVRWAQASAPPFSDKATRQMAEEYEWEARYAESSLAASEDALTDLMVEPVGGDLQGRVRALYERVGLSMPESKSKAAGHLLERTLAKLLLADAMTDDPVVGLDDAVAAYEKLSKFEQAIAATAELGTGAQIFDLSQLTPDELKVFRRAYAKALDGSE